jgi:hypothetical protein
VRDQIFGLFLADNSVLPGWPIDVAEALRLNGETFYAR